MFGAVCSGRPVQVAQQVEPTKYVLLFDNAANINHIAVFLLPQTAFTDPAFTALVYFQLPSSPDFQLLGGLNPQKPTAIFKLRSVAPLALYLADDDMSDSGPNVVLNVGISIEPTAHAEALLAAQKSGSALVPAKPVPPPPLDVALLANKIVGHAYNYLGSFVDASGKVLMKVFDSWWDKFKMKLNNNPNFLNELQ